MRPLEAFLRPTQEELFKMLRKFYKDNKGLCSKGNFIMIEGKAPIMLVAHLDTGATCSVVKSYCT